MIVVLDFLDFIFPVMVVKHCSILALLPYLPSVLPPFSSSYFIYLFIFVMD